MITGTTGFIGSHLLTTLKGRNYNIQVATRHQNSNIEVKTIQVGEIIK